MVQKNVAFFEGKNEGEREEKRRGSVPSITTADKIKFNRIKPDENF
jgi:hypothetical protein